MWKGISKDRVGRECRRWPEEEASKGEEAKDEAGPKPSKEHKPCERKRSRAMKRAGHAKPIIARSPVEKRKALRHKGHRAFHQKNLRMPCHALSLRVRRLQVMTKD